MTEQRAIRQPARLAPLAVPVGDVSLAALQAGDGDQVVLLVPGFTGSKEDFVAVLPLLGAAGYRAVAIDQRGQYQSPGWPDATSYTPDRLGADLVAAADELGAPVHLVGHSFGGLVARAAAIASPERFRSLTLMCSGPAAIPGLRRQVIEALRPVFLEHGLDATYQAMNAAYAADPRAVAPSAEEEAFLHERFVTGEPASLLGIGDALLAEPDRVDELAAAALPTLVLTGSDDDAWGPQLQADMAHRLAARYTVLDGAGHSPALDDPDGAAGVLTEFWRSLDG